MTGKELMAILQPFINDVNTLENGYNKDVAERIKKSTTPIHEALVKYRKWVVEQGKLHKPTTPKTNPQTPKASTPPQPKKVETVVAKETVKTEEVVKVQPQPVQATIKPQPVNQPQQQPQPSTTDNVDDQWVLK